MQIIVTRTKTFMLGAKTETVAPSARLTEVPDWIAETATFKLGVQDKSIQVLQAVEPHKFRSQRPTVPTREEALKAGYAAEAVDGIIQRQRNLQKEWDEEYTSPAPTVARPVAPMTAPPAAAFPPEPAPPAARTPGSAPRPK